MLKKLAFTGALMAALSLAVGYWHKGSEERRWAELTKDRQKTVLFRRLPAFEAFFKRQIGLPFLDISYGYLFDGYRDNVAHLRGSLIQEGRREGKFVLRIFFQDWKVDPGAMELELDIKPAFLKKLPANEFRMLVDQTKKEGDLRATYSGMEWYSSYSKEGDVKLILRTDLPGKWLEDIPDYDRGYTDKMYLEIAPAAVRYLARETFAAPYTEIQLQKAQFNPPDSISRTPVGAVSGFIFPDDGEPIGLRIDAYEKSHLSEPKVTISLTPGGKRLWNAKKLVSLLKPKFWDKNGVREGEGPTFEASLDSGIFVITGDLDDFGKR